MATGRLNIVFTTLDAKNTPERKLRLQRVFFNTAIDTILRNKTDA